MSETDQPSSLDAIYQDRVAFADKHAQWYRRKKRSRQILAIGLRTVATVLVVAGGLCPIAAQAGIKGVEKWGYVLIGLAGGIFLFDKSLGFSAAWLRYMLAASRIEAELESFKLRWAGLDDAGRGNDQRAKRIALAEAFTRTVSEVVLEETKSWQREYVSTAPRAGSGVSNP